MINKINIKKGDIVRYLVGYCVAVKKVYKDDKGELYVKEPQEKRYLYKDTMLASKLGFGICGEKELKYLED